MTDARNWTSGKRPWLIVLVISLLVNLAFVIESHQQEVFRVPTVDAATYHKAALSINADDSIPSDPFWQPPLYQYFLATIYRIGPDSILAARISHSFLGVAISLMVFFLAKRVLPSGWAFVSAVLTVFYGPLLFYTSQLLPVGLATCLDTLALLIVLSFLQKPTLMRGAACGGAIGLAALAVPNILVLLVVVITWTLVSRYRYTENARTASPKTVLCVIAASLVCISPVTIRNFVVSGELVPISTNGGINLYIGNNPDADETEAVRPGINWNKLVAEPFEKGGANNESEAQHYFVRRVASYAFDNPLAFMRGLITKAWRAFNSREIPRNLDVYVFRKYSGVLAALTWRAGSFCFPFGVLLPLAIVGMWFEAGKSRDAAIMLSAVIAYALSIVVFFPTTRYMLPIMPPVIVFAALGVRRVADCVSSRVPDRNRTFCILAALVILCNLPITLPADGVSFHAELLTNVGVGFQTRGEMEKAIGYYRKAAAVAPEYADAHFYMGTALRETGQASRAMESHRRAIELVPDHHRAMNDLAVLLSNDNRVEEAVSLLRQSVALDPSNRKTMYNLAVGLLRQNKLDEANGWLIKAGKPPVTGYQLERLQQQLKRKLNREHYQQESPRS